MLGYTMESVLIAGAPPLTTMSNLCSAYLGSGKFSLPRFGSKREEKPPADPPARPDTLYGFLPKPEAALRRTGTLPTRTKNEAKPKKTTQKLTRHRSLLPSERRAGNVGPQGPLEVQIPVQSARGREAESRRGPCPSQNVASPEKQQQHQQYQQHQHDLSQLSPAGSWGSTKLNTSLNSSGNSLNDSGIDSCGDSSRHTDSSRVSFSSYGSLHQPSPKASPLYGVNWRLQNASMSKPANIPLWVCRDYTPSAVEKGKMRVIGVKRGEIVNALYRTNEWVMVRTAQDQSGFVPFAYTEALGLRRLSRGFTQQYPEWGAPLWRPRSRSAISQQASDIDSQAGSDFQDVSTAAGLHQTSTRQYDPDLSVLEDCANVEFFRSLAPRLARDRNPVMMSSQLSIVPHVGSDISYDDVEDDISLNSLNVSTDSIDSTATESSVFTVTDTGAQLTVLFKYTATQENDISVRKGDIVLELNIDDPDWTWVRTEEGEEGFVPSTYVVNLRKLNLDPRAPTTYL